MNRLILAIIDKLQWLYRWYGVDYQAIRNIVAVKLLMDNRRNQGGMQQYRKKPEDDTSNSKFYWNLGIYGFLGLFISLLIFADISLYLIGTFVFGYAITLTCMMLLADFSNVLFDTRDNAIILPRPVTGKTILVARITHITAYVLMLNLAMCFFFIVFSLFKFPTLTPLIIVLVIIASMLGVFLTIILYLVLMRFTSEERFKDFIAWVQIALSVLFTLGFQIIPRMISKLELTSGIQVVHTWQYFFPACWLGGTLHAVHTGDFSTPNLVFMALTFLSPFVGIWLIVQTLAPAFDKRLAGLGTAADGGGVEVLKIQKRGFQLSDFLGKYLCKSQLEKAIFSLSWKITSRDRKFKMRAYPAIGSFLPMYFFIFRDLDNVSELQESKMYLLLIYFAYLIGSTFYAQSFFSEDFKATWSYFTTPITSPKEVLFGNLKAIFIKFFIPVFIVSSTIVLYIWGWKILPDLALCLLISLVLMLLETGMKSQYILPFSKDMLMQAEAGSQSMRMVIMFVLIPFTGLIHWGLTFLPYGVWGGIALVSIILWYATKRFDTITWEDFE